jgi:hypothetical protein
MIAQQWYALVRIAQRLRGTRAVVTPGDAAG